MRFPTQIREHIVLKCSIESLRRLAKFCQITDADTLSKPQLIEELQLKEVVASWRRPQPIRK